MKTMPVSQAGNETNKAPAVVNKDFYCDVSTYLKKARRRRRAKQGIFGRDIDSDKGGDQPAVAKTKSVPSFARSGLSDDEEQNEDADKERKTPAGKAQRLQRSLTTMR